MQRNVPSLLPTSPLRAPPLLHPISPFSDGLVLVFHCLLPKMESAHFSFPPRSFFLLPSVYMYIFFSLSLSPVVFLPREEDIITVIRLAAKTRFYVMTFLTNGYVHARIDEIHGREKLGCESRESIKRVNVLVHTSN